VAADPTMESRGRMGAVGIILTLGLVALSAKSLVAAIKQRRPVKATFLILIIIVLLVILTSGGYLNVGSGIDVDYQP
jgi:hypothetical protein